MYVHNGPVLFEHLYGSVCDSTTSTVRSRRSTEYHAEYGLPWPNAVYDLSTTTVVRLYVRDVSRVSSTGRPTTWAPYFCDPIVYRYSKLSFRLWVCVFVKDFVYYGFSVYSLCCVYLLTSI